MKIWKKISQLKKIIVITVDSSGVLLRAGLTNTSIPEKAFESLDDIVREFGRSKPIFLHVIGSGVLSKKIIDKPNYRQELVLGGDQNDFIFTSFSDEKNIVVSFVRKSSIDSLLQEIEKNKLHLLGFSCGPALFFALKNDFKVNFDFELEKQKGKILTFQKSPQNSIFQEVDGENVSQFGFLKRCVGELLNNSVDGFDSTGLNFCKEKRLNFKHFRRFRTIGFSVLVSLFVVVVLNRVYQNYLQKKIAILESDLSLNQNNLAYLKRLEAERNRKLELVSSAGVTSKHFISHYLNEIGKSIPSSIRLTSLDLFPVEGKIKDKEKVVINGNVILIEGTTQISTFLDDWMRILNNLDWVSKVELTSYIKKEEEQGFFTLMLKLE